MNGDVETAWWIAVELGDLAGTETVCLLSRWYKGPQGWPWYNEGDLYMNSPVSMWALWWWNHHLPMSKLAIQSATIVPQLISKAENETTSPQLIFCRKKSYVKVHFQILLKLRFFTFFHLISPKCSALPCCWPPYRGHVPHRR